MSDIKLAVQTLLLPGDTIDEQFAAARRYGFDAVEVAVGPDIDLGERLEDVRRASAASSMPVAAICTHPVHDPLQPDPAERAARFGALTTLLSQATELGAAGVVSVPVRPARDFASRDTQIHVVNETMDDAVDAFTQWADSIPAEGASLFLEPLIRFETFFLNRVEQALELAQRVDHPRIQVLGDLFHMNVEESDLGQPFRQAGPRLGHVHIADNNRLQPGLGALDLQAPFAALREIGYSGYVSIECFTPAGPRIEGNPDDAFPASVRYLRDAWQATAL